VTLDFHCGRKWSDATASLLREIRRSWKAPGSQIIEDMRAERVALQGDPAHHQSLELLGYIDCGDQ
jgi:hypothetical protein